MKINSAETKARFAASGRRIATWATAKGHNAQTVSHLIHGHHPVPANQDTPSGRIIADMRADGLLVEEDEGEAEVAA